MSILFLMRIVSAFHRVTVSRQIKFKKNSLIKKNDAYALQINPLLSHLPELEVRGLCCYRSLFYGLGISSPAWNPCTSGEDNRATVRTTADNGSLWTNSSIFTVLLVMLMSDWSCSVVIQEVWALLSCHSRNANYQCMLEQMNVVLKTDNIAKAMWLSGVTARRWRREYVD